MSIKYDPPQNIKFSYIDEKTKENFKIEYDKNKNNIIIIDKDEEAYEYPLLLFIEITDFLRGNNLINVAKSNSLSPPSVVDLKNTSVLPIPNIINEEKSDNDVSPKSPNINTLDLSDISAIVNFSPNATIPIPIEQKKIKENEETETKIEKRPVLNGSISADQASAIRGVGSEKNVIRRN